MHSAWTRSNAVFFFALTVLGILSGLCAVSTVFHDAKPDVSVLKLNRLRSL